MYRYYASLSFLTGKLYLSWLALVTVAYLYNAVACTLRPSFVTALVNSHEVNSTWVNRCSTNTTNNSTEPSFFNFTTYHINMTERMMNITNPTASKDSNSITTWLDLNDTSTSSNTHSIEVISVTEKYQEMDTSGTHPKTNSAQTTVQTVAYNVSDNGSTFTGIGQTIPSRYETIETSVGLENTLSECWEQVNETYYYYKEGTIH